MRLQALRYDLNFDVRHLDQLSGPLLTGVTELIWNSIDADAHHIDVEVVVSEMDGIREVVVVDDGHGFDLEEARAGFLTLGRSAKAGGGRSRLESRAMHGSKGQGRFQLFRHGGVARWRSVAQDASGKRFGVGVEIRHGDDGIDIDDLGEVTDPVGTRVVLSDFGEAPVGLRGTGVADLLLGRFALRIEEHALEITYDGEPLDPSSVREARDELLVPIPGQPDPLGLTVVQWTRRVGKQDLYLCDEKGSTLERISANVAPPASVYYTAYLRWDGFKRHLNRLVLSDMADGELGSVLAGARRRLEQHFDDVSVRRRRRVIADWRREGVYPYEKSAQAGAPDPTRDTFDLVALEAADTINRGPKQSKRLSLRLLQEALERNPGHIHTVLDEVLRLPEDRLREFAELLERTKLSSVIKTSRSIADRLDFLEALAQMTCEPDVSGEVLEREHLHLILENETWIFGEEYALAASEAGLTQVLRRHIEILGRDEVAPNPVRQPNGRLARLDLMLSAAVEHNDDVIEHLVIELKRPSRPIGSKELQQVKDYALAIVSRVKIGCTPVS